jgi:hypothetical protein
MDNIEIRNAIYLEDGKIDCEFNHPKYGWIPFTASPDDSQEIGRLVHAEALKANPAAYVAPKVVITSEMVSIERDRRIGLGFMFAGKLFDFDMKAKTNISGAAQMAFMAIVANPAVAKSDRWNGGANPFAWRTFDNTFMTMTGEMVIALGQAAAAHEASFMAAAWKLKDQAEIPADYTDDQYWP